jgi:hypothetical protein
MEHGATHGARFRAIGGGYLSDRWCLYTLSQLNSVRAIL